MTPEGWGGEEEEGKAIILTQSLVFSVYQFHIQVQACTCKQIQVSTFSFHDPLSFYLFVLQHEPVSVQLAAPRCQSHSTGVVDSASAVAAVVCVLQLMLFCSGNVSHHFEIVAGWLAHVSQVWRENADTKRKSYLKWLKPTEHLSGVVTFLYMS